MHRLTVALAVLCAAATAEENRLKPAEQSSGWILLFNGRDMTGWHDPRQMKPSGDAWTVENGCLKAQANPRVTEDLFTTRSYGDFELAFDWRISPGGNSGVKYRIQDHVFLLDKPVKRFEDLVNLSLERRRSDRPSRGQDYVIGFEYQLLDDSRHPDARAGATHRTGAVYDMIAPSRQPSRPAGEWNQSRILLRGDHIEHWLNGVKVVDGNIASADVVAQIVKRWGAGTPVAVLLTKQPHRLGPISLQNHGNEAWFRNIKVRLLRAPSASSASPR